jgi:hypothetical protein
VQLENEETVILGSNTIPSILAKSAKYAKLEFAGVKFSSFSETGKDYLRHIGKDIIGKIKHQLPLLRNIVICEEKYKFTPDDFKAAKRSQRKTLSFLNLWFGAIGFNNSLTKIHMGRYTINLFDLFCNFC